MLLSVSVSLFPLPLFLLLVRSLRDLSRERPLRLHDPRELTSPFLEEAFTSCTHLPPINTSSSTTQLLDGTLLAMEGAWSHLAKIAQDPHLISLYQVAIPYHYTQDNPVIFDQPLHSYSTKIYVTETDCLEASSILATYLQNNQRPLVMNMANSFNCGGSFFGSRGSQEEYIIRNSSLLFSLWPHRRVDDNRWPEGDTLFPLHHHDQIYYPFTNCGGIYSPEVEVFNFSHHCSVISIAQQDLRKDRPYPSGGEFNYELTVQNLRSFFSIAASNGHTHLVLGAIGCGAFENPPNEVSRAFFELLQPGGEFHEVFETIIFAIIKSEDNILAFERYFGPRVIMQHIYSIC